MKASRFLSYILRHEPESIGLSLDSKGWADLDELIDCAGRHGRHLNRRTIRNVIINSDKQRFLYDEDRSRIRAIQGHSIPVDLGLKPEQPPGILFHGTSSRFLESILQTGLRTQGRHHVHLSADIDTAKKVGMRRGKAIILTIDTKSMATANHLFYVTENGIWLVTDVPSQYLSVLEEKI